MAQSVHARFTPSSCIPEVRHGESGICRLRSMARGPMKSVAMTLADPELREETRRLRAARGGDAGRLLRRRRAGHFARGTLIGASAGAPWESSTHRPCHYASVDDGEFFRGHRLIRRRGSASPDPGAPLPRVGLCPEENHRV